MKRLFLLLVLAGTAVIYPVTANAASSSSSTGTVVARSGQLIAIASPSGVVQTVRSSSRAGIGARVRVTGSTVRVIGRARAAHIRGVVVRSSSGRLVLAAGRSLVVMNAAHGRRLASLSANSTSTPAPGTTVDANTSISSSGQLDLTSLTSGGNVGSIQIQATVQSVAPGVIILTVNGQQIQFTLPAGLTLPASLQGQTVSLTLNLTGAGPIATPSHSQGDDDENDDQDEQDNEQQGGGDD